MKQHLMDVVDEIERMNGQLPNVPETLENAGENK
jgi:hypothetical protein